MIVEAGNVAALTSALDHVILELSEAERRALAGRARDHAVAFDRGRIFDDLFRPGTTTRPASLDTLVTCAAWRTSPGDYPLCEVGGSSGD